MVPYMAQKTTVYLDPPEYQRLRRIAHARGCATAMLVREAVAEYTARHGTRRTPRSVGAFTSGRHDLSERAEDLLSGMGRSRP